MFLLFNSFGNLCTRKICLVGTFCIAGFQTASVGAAEKGLPSPQITTLGQYWETQNRGTDTPVRFRAQNLYFDPDWKMLFFQRTVTLGNLALRYIKH